MRPEIDAVRLQAIAAGFSGKRILVIGDLMLDEFLWGTKRRQGAVEAAAKSATRTVANGLGRQIVRGILGSLFGGRKR